MKRDAAQTIFRTVVFAGAMLGGGAGCSKKPAQTTPSTVQQGQPMSADPQTPPATEGDKTAKPGGEGGDNPCGDNPCGGERPRGTDDDGGGGEGRGFILS